MSGQYHDWSIFSAVRNLFAAKNRSFRYDICRTLLKNDFILNTSVTTASTNVTPTTEKRLALILDSIQDIKGKNIVKLDLRKLDDRPAEFFFVCEGESTTQVSAIANNVQKRMKQELGELPKTATGGRHANWICLDYFDVVVHVFYPETRKFYELEDLWSDAEVTNY